MPDVTDELQRLRESAVAALRETGAEVEIEDAQLLRRQIARRCIYGVDLNRIAVDLARLAIWVHTFVPGLPLSFLDHNLVVGNSLVGIATRTLRRSRPARRQRKGARKMSLVKRGKTWHAHFFIDGQRFRQSLDTPIQFDQTATVKDGCE